MRPRLVIAIGFLAIAAGCSRTAPPPAADSVVNELQKELVNPSGTEEVYRTWQYSQAVRSGSTLWVSGQVGFDPETGQIPEDIESQSRLALRNLERVIDEAGASLDDVVELVSYHTDMREFPVFARVKSEFFVEGFPAWTAVGVSALVEPRVRVEIRATVVIGSGPAIEEPVEEETPVPPAGT
jgi:reactive intermediate/imine deaminase